MSKLLQEIQKNSTNTINDDQLIEIVRVIPGDQQLGMASIYNLKQYQQLKITKSQLNTLIQKNNLEAKPLEFAQFVGYNLQILKKPYQIDEEHKGNNNIVGTYLSVELETGVTFQNQTVLEDALIIDPDFKFHVNVEFIQKLTKLCFESMEDFSLTCDEKDDTLEQGQLESMLMFRKMKIFYKDQIINKEKNIDNHQQQQQYEEYSQEKKQRRQNIHVEKGKIYTLTKNITCDKNKQLFKSQNIRILEIQSDGLYVENMIGQQFIIKQITKKIQKFGLTDQYDYFPLIQYFGVLNYYEIQGITIDAQIYLNIDDLEYKQASFLIAISRVTKDDNIQFKSKKQEQIVQFKEKGNNYFKKNQVNEAYEEYMNALDILEERISYKSISCEVFLLENLKNMVVINNNLAQLFIKMQEYENSIEYAEKSINNIEDCKKFTTTLNENENQEQNINNTQQQQEEKTIEFIQKQQIKAFFRIAISHKNLGQNQLADEYFQKILNLEPQNAQVLKEIGKNQTKN